MDDLAQIMGQLPIGVWVAAVPTGQAVFTNAAFRAIMGTDARSSSQIIDAPKTYGIFDRAGREYPVEKLPFSQVVQSGKPVMVDDLVIHRSDGERIDVRAFAHPIFGESGALTHVSIAFIDITREAQAENDRDQARARLAMAVDHSPIVIWSADASGRITLSQGAALSSLGVRSGELVGQNIFDLYRGHPTISYFRRVLAGETLQYVAEVGDAVLDSWLTPIRGKDGSVIGVSGLSHDIRELRRLQAASIQTDRAVALGTLAASVAHEINNPLTYILAHAEEIDNGIDQLEAELPEPLREQLRAKFAVLRDDFLTLRLGTERIAAITRELRTFNHPDDASQVPIDARAAVRSVLRLVGKELEDRATVSLELGETVPVMGHASRLVQVVLNLVMNAMQSLPRGPAADNQLGIRTETRGERVVIEVEDSGSGVPLADHERIFEPFFTTKPVGEGSGLGLFVCRNIVRGYGGEVTVHAREGGGSLFRVTLPASAEEPLTRREGAAAAAEGGVEAAHVLIIDDDPRVAKALCGSLRRAGYRVSSCTSAASGLSRLLADKEIDLVFCDLMMKGMTGMDLHARLRELDPALLSKVVFMTGGAHSPAAREFLAAHSDDIVEKPFDLPGETRRRLLARR